MVDQATVRTTIAASPEACFAAAIDFERYDSSADFAIGNVAIENPGLVSFNVISINFTTRF